MNIHLNTDVMEAEFSEEPNKEAIAVEAFKEYRLENGITCKKCGGSAHYWLKSKLQFQCKKCKFRTTLRSGTLLEGSKLPFNYFFIAIQLLNRKGNNVTVEEFQRNTSHKYYDPLWDFLKRVKDFVNTKNEHQNILTKYAERFNSSVEVNSLR